MPLGVQPARSLFEEEELEPYSFLAPIGSMRLREGQGARLSAGERTTSYQGPSAEQGTSRVPVCDTL